MHFLSGLLLAAALGLCTSCRSFLVVHDGDLGIGSYSCSTTSPAEGARYACIRGIGILVGRSGLTIGLVDRRRLSIDLAAPPAHILTDLAEVWINPEDAAAPLAAFVLSSTTPDHP